MSNTESIPVFSLLNSIESIYKTKGKYRFVFFWAYLASAWIIATTALFIAFMMVGKEAQAIIIIAIGVLAISIGFPVFISAIFTVRYTRKVSNQLENFLGKFYPLLVKVKLEMFPAKGATEEEILTNKINDLLPSYQKLVLTPKESARIDGETLNFDLMMGRKKRLALAKVVHPEQALTEKELSEIANDAHLISKKLKSQLKLLLLFQEKLEHSPINIEEIDLKAKLKGTTIVFLNRSGDSFDVSWVSPP